MALKNMPTIEYVKIEDIKSDGANPNRMTKLNLRALERNIKKYGFLTPVITNKDLLIADGEHRLQAARSIGMTEVPVFRLDVNEVDRRMLRQIMNKLKGEHDRESDLIEYQFLYNEKSFEEFRELLPSASDYEKMLERSNAKVDSDNFDADKASQNPKYKVQQGDVYILGKHRLMCGDSTNQEDVLKLMDGDLAKAIFTDPPYGVSYKGTNNPNGREWKVIENDDLRGDGLQEFLTKAFTNAFKVTIANPALYSCYASINHRQFETALITAGFKIKQQLVWDKGHVLGHSDYHWCHEPILYCIKKDRNCAWLGDRRQKTVLNNTDKDLKDYKKEELLAYIEEFMNHRDLIRIRKDGAQSYVHPTQKPVELPKSCLRNNTEINDLVYEPFGGSGSTLIGCHEMSRRCYAMEFDPKYVSAILERWDKLTNQKPVLVRSK